MQATPPRAGLLAFALLACTHTLQIPQPAPAGPGAPLPPLAPSRIDAPLTADVRATLAQLESQVPQTFDTGGQFRMIGPTPVGVRYTVRRQPFQFTARDGVLHAETVLALSAEACVGAPLGIALPFLGNACQSVASCGSNGEHPRRVTVGADTTLALDPSWRIVSQTQPTAPVVHDPCLLTPFHIDVSGFVAQMVNEQVSAATRQMDADIAQRGDLRPRAEAFWQNLQTPIDLGEGFWLLLQPERVRAAPFALDPNTVRTSVGISARPYVLSGARPEVPVRPLPPLEPSDGSNGGGFRMTFDTFVSFADATSLIAREFRNRTMRLRGYDVLVRDIRVTGHGNALLFTINARFQSGPFSGQDALVYMAGLADYDAQRRALVVRDLDYTLETQSSLLSAGEALMRGSLREELAEKAVFPLGDRIDRLRTRAEQALTRPLAQGTNLRGRLSGVRPVATSVTAEGVVLRVEADGQAEVTQDLSVLEITGPRR